MNLPKLYQRCMAVTHSYVMAGLVPAIHVLFFGEQRKTWMPGTRPGMTVRVGRYLTPLVLVAISLATMICLCAPARAQERAQDQYPSRLITIVVPITPGTTIDILARLYADKLSKTFGQQVVVANRPGAGGLIAAQAVANAPADGYTVLFANSGHAILGTLNKNLPFDPVRDFAGVSLVGEAPTIVTVPPSLGVSDLNEFVALAKAKSGALNYGSAGIGTATHLAGAYFALVTDTDLVHIPYTVSATIIADLLGARLQASFVPMAFVLALLQDGRLRALAVSAKEPVTDPIRIPTALSQGVDYQNATWYGILAPAKTPGPVRNVLHQAIAEAGKDAELQAKVRAQGIEPRDIGLEKFDAHIRNDMARLAPLLKTIGEKR